MGTDRSARVFGNEIDKRAYAKACKAKKRYARRFGDGTYEVRHLEIADAPVIGNVFGTYDGAYHAVQLACEPNL